MAIIRFEGTVMRAINDGAAVYFDWPRTGESFTYDFSIDGGRTYSVGANTIEETPDDGDVAEYCIPYDAAERPSSPENVIYRINDGTDTGKIKVYVGPEGGGLTPGPSPPSNGELTSLDEMEDIFSEAGVQNFTFDDMTASQYNRLIQQATAETLTYLGGRYAIEDLEQNWWVRMKTTYIALYYLTRRMGEPGLYIEDYQEALMDLAQARDGIRYLDMPTTDRVVVQTPMQDARFFRTGRIDHGRSSKVYPGQRLRYFIGYGW